MNCNHLNQWICILVGTSLINHQDINEQLQDVELQIHGIKRQMKTNQRVHLQQMQVMRTEILNQMQGIRNQIEFVLNANGETNQPGLQEENGQVTVEVNNLQDSSNNNGNLHMSLVQRNKLHRLHNRGCANEAALQSIVREDEQVPPNFPATKRVIYSLKGAQLLSLLKFYRLDAGRSLDDRRTVLLRFIELEQVVA